MSDSLPKIPERTPLRVAFTFVGGLLAFLVFGVAIWLIVRSYSNAPTVEDQRATVRLNYKAEVETSSKRLLETYGWIDEAKGLAHVPVTEAMKAVVEEYSHMQVGPSSIPVPGTPAAEAAAAALMGGGGAQAPSAEAAPVPTAPDSPTVNPEALIPAEPIAPTGGASPATETTSGGTVQSPEQAAPAPEEAQP